MSVTTVESSGGAPPAALESVSHVVSFVAVQVSGPDPVLVLLMRSENACGSALPWNAESLYEVGETERIGGGLMVSVTAIVTGLPVAFADVTTTLPV